MKQTRRVLLVLLVLSILGGSSMVLPPHLHTTAHAAEPSFCPGEVLVKVVPGTGFTEDATVVVQDTPNDTPPSPATLAQLAALLNSQDTYTAELIAPGSDTYRLSFGGEGSVPRFAQQLAANPAVVFAQPNYRRQRALAPDDPTLQEQWALGTIGVFNAWDITTGDGVIVAVVDTGVSAIHPDLAGKVLPGYNAMLNNNWTDDDNGHGTAIAGLVAANTNNANGVAGVCWGCRILPIKVLDSFGIGEDANLARGIRWAASNGAHIINLSIGGVENSPILQDAIHYAFHEGSLIVAAAGNDRMRGNFVNYPAAYPHVVAVGATDRYDVLTEFSTTGDYVDLVAPGIGVWTTTLGGEYGTPNGTSFSSPFVSGVAGLILTVRGDLRNVDVECILKASADDKGPPGWDAEYGWGRLNALRAVQLAQNYTTCPLNTPQPAPAAPIAPATPVAPEPQPPQPAAPAVPDAQPAGSISEAFAPAAPVADTSECTYFPDTQHTLCGAFLDYWHNQGGLAIFGMPISEAFVETDEQTGQTRVVQYFERHRFEQHPDLPPPDNVQLSRLGAELLTVQGQNWFAFEKGSYRDGCLFFQETGHSLCGAFLGHWRSHGLELDGTPGTDILESLSLFGQPLSEPYVETTPAGDVTVQWFERARFEQDPSGVVRLGLVGSELVQTPAWRAENGLPPW